MTDVCVVGSFMMDLVVRAPRRPGPGETLVGSSFEMFLGGKGFNQAVASARSGAATAMVGMVGDDDFGRRFAVALGRDGIDASRVLTTGAHGTGVAAPLVEDSGENSIVIVPRANHAMTAAEVRRAEDLIAGSRVLLLQLELPEPVVVEAARIGREAGVTVVLNPAPAVDTLSAFAGLIDYVVPNEAEATHLTGIACDAEEMPRLAKTLEEQTGGAGVVLTLGSRGVIVFGGDTVELIDAHDQPCVDTVGAGDAFCGAMAASLARGAALIEAVRYGNAAGALAITKHGAEPSMPRREDIARLLRTVQSH